MGTATMFQRRADRLREIDERRKKRMQDMYAARTERLRRIAGSRKQRMDDLARKRND